MQSRTVKNSLFQNFHLSPTPRECFHVHPKSGSSLALPAPLVYIIAHCRKKTQGIIPQRKGTDHQEQEGWRVQGRQNPSSLDVLALSNFIWHQVPSIPTAIVPSFNSTCCSPVEKNKIGKLGPTAIHNVSWASTASPSLPVALLTGSDTYCNTLDDLQCLLPHPLTLKNHIRVYNNRLK